MLVKFISFVITVFGTKRYQPFVFASVALLISVAGVTTVLSTYDTAADTAASTADHAKDTTTDTLNDQTPATKSLREDATNEQTSDEPSTAAPAQPSEQTRAIEKQTAGAAVIQLNPSADTIVLKAGETSAALTASLSDNSTVQWTISSNPANNLTITPASQDTSSSSKTSFTVKAATAGTYTLTVHAKDAVRGVDATKTITLTITAS
jgi:hypothetical protein